MSGITSGLLKWSGYAKTLKKEKGSQTFLHHHTKDIASAICGLEEKYTLKISGNLHSLMKVD